MQESEVKRKRISKVWVLITLVVGVVLGLILAAAQSQVATPWRPGGGHGQGQGGGWAGVSLDTADDIDVILSTVSIVLLVALIFIYSRTYADTKARFALGLVGVLVALLLQSILTSPMVYGVFGGASGEIGTYLLLSDVFKIGAFTVFMYLSLD